MTDDRRGRFKGIMQHLPVGYKDGDDLLYDTARQLDPFFRCKEIRMEKHQHGETAVIMHKIIDLRDGSSNSENDARSRISDYI